jgi:hypothetical protein
VASQKESQRYQTEIDKDLPAPIIREKEREKKVVTFDNKN